MGGRTRDDGYSVRTRERRGQQQEKIWDCQTMSLAVVDLKEECLDEEELEGTSYTYPFTFQNKETASGDQPVPYPDRNIISQLLRKGIVKTRNADTSEPGDPVDLCPARPVQEVSPQGSLFKRQLESEGFYEEFLKAKRARVENIVCNISSSCSSGFRNGGSSEGEDPVGSSYETPRRDAHTRKVERGQERSELKLQMEKMRDQLLQLQEKLYRMYTGMSEDYSGIGHPKERAARGVSGAGATKSRDPTDESCHFQDSKLSKERQKSRQSNVTEHGIRMLDSQPKCLAEALKEELSTAVTQVVDAVVQAFVRTGVQEVLPPVQVTSSHRLMEHGGSSTGTSSQPTPHYFEALSTGTSSEGDTVNFEEDQTEALPLVVRKNPTSQCESSSSHRQRLSPLGLDEGGLVVATFPPEGLTPGHLKKAKLMFFYCRYPSSSTLKTYFNDVKFNRSITSQLIKWFSNFREFFYIQMEKFSRQAVTEGVVGADRLTVTRDSELARILNQHYNKSSDYEIPAKFLEVSQITLREFFSAVLTGKDADPSWKKAIYKVICKLDSDIPEAFKSTNCLLETMNE
ncbi:hypothetical protein NDU88_006015 [Pleurodeles waltl]|uniref:Prospero domain-containing protein n=2 Tax=Pleurodeles waltl TaxID=8319 RepID=A0AAV7N028_PLEWA|nr:hypothetical protein NDU88_006015 [Pleurodeles waltl]